MGERKKKERQTVRKIRIDSKTSRMGDGKTEGQKDRKTKCYRKTRRQQQDKGKERQKTERQKLNRQIRIFQSTFICVLKKWKCL